MRPSWSRAPAPTRRAEHARRRRGRGAADAGSRPRAGSAGAGPAGAARRARPGTGAEPDHRRPSRRDRQLARRGRPVEAGHAHRGDPARAVPAAALHPCGRPAAPRREGAAAAARRRPRRGARHPRRPPRAGPAQPSHPAGALPHRPRAAPRRAQAPLPARRAPLRRGLAGAGCRQLRGDRLQQDPQQQLGRSTGADAVHPQHLARLRDGRQRARSARRDHGRRQLPARVRRAPRHPAGAVRVQPVEPLRARGEQLRAPHPAAPAVALRASLVADLRETTKGLRRLTGPGR